MTILLELLAVAVIGFAAGVAEAQRVINAIDAAAGTIHLKIASADQAVHEKLDDIKAALADLKK